MKSITQYPTPPNTWLHDSAPDYTRIFTDYIIRPETVKPWAECTDEEKAVWEKEHPAPEEPEENGVEDKAYSGIFHNLQS